MSTRGAEKLIYVHFGCGRDSGCGRTIALDFYQSCVMSWRCVEKNSGFCPPVPELESKPCSSLRANVKAENTCFSPKSGLREHFDHFRCSHQISLVCPQVCYEFGQNRASGARFRGWILIGPQMKIAAKGNLSAIDWTTNHKCKPCFG